MGKWSDSSHDQRFGHECITFHEYCSPIGQESVAAKLKAPSPKYVIWASLESIGASTA